MSIDKLTIEILPDGTIKTSSDQVSQANHDNAEKFLAAMARLAGGSTSRVSKKGAPVHHHHEGGKHVHN
jgi:hypothetical protein